VDFECVVIVGWGGVAWLLREFLDWEVGVRLYDVWTLVSSCFKRNKMLKSREVKVLTVLYYMFHGSCRKVFGVLSMALEPISKSTAHYLAKKVSEIRGCY
jgi:hypothetical protein